MTNAHYMLNILLTGLMVLMRLTTNGINHSDGIIIRLMRLFMHLPVTSITLTITIRQICIGGL